MMNGKLPTILLFIGAFIVCIIILFIVKKIMNELDNKIKELHDCEKNLEKCKKDISDMIQPIEKAYNEIQQNSNIKETEENE